MKEKKQSGEKRYIVTYVDSKTDAATASQILNVSASSVANGIELMATSAEFGGADILHLDGIGSTVLSLSDQKAEELKQDNRVLAVEEDVEVFAFETLEDYQQDVETASNEQDPYYHLAQEYFKQGFEQGKAESQKGFFEQLQQFLGGQNTRINTGNTSGNAFSRTGNPFTGLQQRTDYPFPTPATSPFARPTPSQLFPVQPTPWNIAMVKAPAAWARGLRGNGIKVAVIDTGIAAHADLGVSGGASFVPGLASYNDDNGHGTHCAGIIAARNNFIGVIGVAPAASLYAVKVLNSAGSGMTSWILAGMTWARQNGMKVVSMSLGANVPPMVAYQNAITQLTNSGISVVCASGNSGQTAFPYVGAPANSHPLAIAVGAVDINKIIAPWSSRGTHGSPWNPVTLVAPGVSINSTFPFPASSYKTLSGTSMACPHVAGAVALIKQKFPLFTPAQVKAKLIVSSSDLGVPGNDPTYGSGLLNCDKATL